MTTQSRVPNWYAVVAKTNAGWLAHYVQELRDLKEMYLQEQFPDRKAGQAIRIRDLTGRIDAEIRPDSKLLWLAEHSAEPCTPPEGWRQGWLARPQIQAFSRNGHPTPFLYVGPIPSEVQTLAHAAIQVFGAMDVSIYTPDPSHLQAIPVSTLRRDPMLVVWYKDRNYRLALWGVAEDLKVGGV